jgi:catechol-2,3-dioxygenase
MKRLGHIALITPDKAPMMAYYTSFLGLHVVYDTKHSTLLRLSESEFDCGVALIEDAAATRGPLDRYNHLGFNVTSREELHRYIEKAHTLGISCEGPFDDAYIGYYAYFKDPDGNGVELSTPEGVNRF